MTELSGDEVTRLLRSWRDGDRSALDRLIALMHSELRRLASFHFNRERPGHTLQPTAVVNELYLRLIGETDIPWERRVEFLKIASRQMRQILVDHARAKNAEKRGGGRARVILDDALLVSPADDPAKLLAVNDALESLGKLDERCSSIAELRVFGGLQIDEVAEALGLSRSTVEREWRVAKLWLRKKLGPS